MLAEVEVLFEVLPGRDARRPKACGGEGVQGRRGPAGLAVGFNERRCISAGVGTQVIGVAALRLGADVVRAGAGECARGIGADDGADRVVLSAAEHEGVAHLAVRRVAGVAVSVGVELVVRVEGVVLHVRVPRERAPRRAREVLGLVDALGDRVEVGEEDAAGVGLALMVRVCEEEVRVRADGRGVVDEGRPGEGPAAAVQEGDGPLGRGALDNAQGCDYGRVPLTLVLSGKGGRANEYAVPLIVDGSVGMLFNSGGLSD